MFQVGPTFWQYFDPVKVQDACSHEQFIDAVQYLHTVVMEYLPCVRKLESVPSLKSFRKSDILLTSSNWTDVMILFIKAVIFNTIPSTFRKAVNDFYSDAFRVFHHTSGEDEKGESQNLCSTNVK